MTMIQELLLVNITKNCFSTYSSRLLFTLISKSDFCTRNELADWTGFSSITILRYLQEFGKTSLIENAPGIVYLSEFGKKVFDSLGNLFQNEIEIANNINYDQ
jgi:DeoR/GlpR family transcriptional regulator of sugar metabolism